MRRTTRLPYAGFAVFCLTLWARLASGQPGATLAHGTCVASMGRTTYVSQGFSAPFEKDPRGAEPSYHTMLTWGAAFSEYVEQKYGGAKGSSAATCALSASLEQAQAGVKPRMATAIRLGRKAVETDWVYKTAAAPPPASTPAPAASAGQTPQTPNANAQGTTIRAVCWSDLAGPGGVIYFSQVFDTELGRPDQTEDIFSPMANEFHQYLKGRYDYKTSASRPISCAGSLSQGQTSAQRSDVMTRFGTGKRVVELEWEFSPGSAEAAPGVTALLDGGYCVSPGTTGTVYTAGPFQLKGRSNATYEWNRAFSQFLAGKYAFRGEVSCPIGMPHVRAQRWFSFHVQGARAGNKKVVETGWELCAAAPSSAAAKPNEDKEPVRPAAPAATPSQQVRDLAIKEAPEVMAYCQKDRAREWALDCQKVQRLVYNYRLAHAADGTPEPLEALLTGDKLDCSDCVDNMRTPGWAKQQAHAAGNKPAVVECVAQQIVAAFRAKPYISRLKEAYEATLAACKR